LVNESFYGIGPHTLKSDRSLFTYEKTYAEFDLGTRLASQLDLKAQINFEHANIFRGKQEDIVSMVDLYNKNDIPGLENKIKIIGGLVELYFDGRKYRKVPISGQEFKLGGAFYTEMWGDGYTYWKMMMDLKQVIHLFYGRTLHFRIAGEMTEPMNGKEIPFYNLSEIGKRETIRGFTRGRFRDRDMVLGSVEYAFPIWRRLDSILDFIIFGETGQVAHDIFKDFNANDLQWAYGIGIRLWVYEEETMVLFLGRSREQWRIYATLNP
jgi:outer membrane protein assembly factor BamA